MDVKLLTPDFCDSILAFEKEKLIASGLSEIQVEMKSWDFPWRKESLDHYAKVGWSFVAIENEKIKGYILGQPFVFFNNWTQTLWLEYSSFPNQEVGEALFDVSIRWAKSKHLQKVILNPNGNDVEFVKEIFPKFKEGEFLHLSTTKLSEG